MLVCYFCVANQHFFVPYSNKYYMVDILVRTHNSALTVRRCLESIYAQTFKNFHVIVSDDASTDNTVQIVQALFPQTEIHINETCLGAGLNRKQVLSYATKPYVTFVDADDFLDKNYLEVLMDRIKHQKVSVVKSGRKIHTETRTFEETTWGTYSSKQDIINHMNLDYMSNYIFKRSLFDKIEWFDKTNCEDGSIILQIADKIDKLFETKNTFYHWDRTHSQLSANKTSLLWYLNSFHSALYRYSIYSKYGVGKSLEDVCQTYLPSLAIYKDEMKRPECQKIIEEIKKLGYDIDWNLGMFESKLKVALCAIAKNENLYLKEWVEYYISMGVDKIFLYDNNELDGERFEEVISEYVKKGVVEIIDVRGVEKGCVFNEQGINLQTKCYIDCYTDFGKDYDWMMFFDIDEFLTFKDGWKLKKYLESDYVKKADTVLVSWEHYDDNGKLFYEDEPVRARFTHISHIDRRGVKSIVRTKKEILDPTLHNMIHNFTLKGSRFVYATGSNKKLRTKGSDNRWWLVDKDEHERSVVVLNHYKTKTVEEFVKRHLNRHWGTSQTIAQHAKGINDIILDFFKYNEYTTKKMEYLLKFNTND